MKKEYDFSNAVKNSYNDKNLKKQISININVDIIENLNNIININNYVIKF